MYVMTTIRLGLIGMYLLVGTALAADALTYPATSVGSRAGSFFTAYNGGDEAVLRRYVKAHFDPRVFETVPAGDLVNLIRDLWEELGALTPRAISTQTPTTLTLHIQADKAGDRWFEARFAVTEAASAKLRTFSLNPSLSPDLADKSYEGWRSLSELARAVARDIGVPGLAVAVFANERTEVAAWGVRVHGLPEMIHHSDRFHLGSITKSMTSTMIGRLVELGVVDWKTRIGDILSDIDMRPEYRTVTLEALLRHRGGIVSHLPYSEKQLGAFRVGNPIEQRAAFVADVLKQGPSTSSIGSMRYSNAGYVIAGHMVERAAGQSWETLMRSHVLGPLNMTSADFGWPATTSRPHQPRGHRTNGASLTPQPLDDSYELGPLFAPAGDVHGSIVNLATYATAHLRGLRGRDGILKAETFRRLHALPANVQGTVPYAAGWVVEARWGEGIWHWHNGTAGTFYALVMIHPASQMAVAVAMNAAPGGHEATAMKMVHAVYRNVRGGTAPTSRNDAAN